MRGTYDTGLVALSILIAILSSFTALSIANRIRASAGWTRRIWLSASASTLGGGIWSMHFVAMLAFSMPGMHISYDVGLTLVSLALPILFTGFGFATVAGKAGSASRAAAAGVLMGSGVVAMHYIGMAAMRMQATITYEKLWVAISVLIAIGAATAAVWLAARDHKAPHRLAAAVLMGIAISGMHYTAMAGAIFTAAPVDVGRGVANVSRTYIAAAISAVTLLILLVAFGAARLEQLFLIVARREARIALRLKIADKLRDRSSPEDLDEIAALMGKHFAVTRTGFGQLDPVEDVFDYDVCWTDGTVPPLLGRFPAAAFGVKIVGELKAGRTVAVEDLLEAELSNERWTRETAREVDTRSILVVPFVRNGQLRTIVYLNDRNPHKWHSEDIAFMEELAERTRLVIEREAAEAQLRELNAQLEARVEARTQELRQTQDALLQSQKMEAIGQLASGLAHDFNNLLGAVVGALDVIRRRADDPNRVKQLAEAGLQAAQRGSRLTSQLLAFSRTQSIELQPLFVCDVIEGLHELLKRTLGPQIELDFRLNPAPIPVLADPTQVEMMVLNLAINSRDAMPDGGTLTISTALKHVCDEAELDDGDYVQIIVSDTGSGMDEATLRRAMEPFFTTKPVGKGTGLGLAQIYGSARQAGGTVRIESAPDAGTTVRVLLPRTDRTPVRRIEEGDGPETDLGGSASFLLVDDDDDHRKMLASGLEALGHEVRQATDGGSALSALAIKRPDVLLLDFAMPGMNGAEVARETRRRWPDLPIVFMSGFADTQAIRSVEGDRIELVRKPFRLGELIEAVRTVRSPTGG